MTAEAGLAKAGMAGMPAAWVSQAWGMDVPGALRQGNIETVAECRDHDARTVAAGLQRSFEMMLARPQLQSTN